MSFADSHQSPILSTSSLLPHLLVNGALMNQAKQLIGLVLTRKRVLDVKEMKERKKQQQQQRHRMGNEARMKRRHRRRGPVGSENR